MNSVVAILVSVVEPSSPWVAAFSGSPRLADADTGAEDSHRSEESGTAGAGGRESNDSTLNPKLLIVGFGVLEFMGFSGYRKCRDLRQFGVVGFQCHLEPRPFGTVAWLSCGLSLLLHCVGEHLGAHRETKPYTPHGCY